MRTRVSEREETFVHKFCCKMCFRIYCIQLCNDMPWQRWRMTSSYNLRVLALYIYIGWNMSMLITKLYILLLPFHYVNTLLIISVYVLHNYTFYLPFPLFFILLLHNYAFYSYPFHYVNALLIISVYVLLNSYRFTKPLLFWSILIVKSLSFLPECYGPYVSWKSTSIGCYDWVCCIW